MLNLFCNFRDTLKSVTSSSTFNGMRTLGYSMKIILLKMLEHLHRVRGYIGNKERDNIPESRID